MKLKSINYKIKIVTKQTKIVSTAPVRPDIYLSNFGQAGVFEMILVSCLFMENKTLAQIY